MHSLRIVHRRHPCLWGVITRRVPPQKVDISKGLAVHGRILSARGCAPIADARIEHWQTGTKGFYEDRLRAYLYSDEEGNYRFQTEWPGAPVPHIHFRVSATGFKTLVTQWVGRGKVDRITFELVLESMQ